MMLEEIIDAECELRLVPLRLWVVETSAFVEYRHVGHADAALLRRGAQRVEHG